MEIEYSIAFTTQEQAEKCALYLLAEERKISFNTDEESDAVEWLSPFMCIWNQSIQTL